MRKLKSRQQKLALGDLFDNELLVNNLSVDADTSSLLSHYLRHYSGRNDLAKLPQNSSGSDENWNIRIETVRSLVFEGSLKEALILLENMKTNNDFELAELNLEKMRCLLGLGETEKVVRLSNDLLRNSGLSFTSKVTCHQLLGHALWLMKDLMLAEAHLQKAVDLGQTVPDQRSVFSALAFLVIVQVEQNFIEQAERTIEILESKINLIQNLSLRIDRAFFLFRAKYFYFKHIGDFKHATYSLLEAREVVLWLGEKGTFEKCETDLQSIARAGYDFRKEAIKEILTVKKGWVYLKRWRWILSRIPKSAFDLSTSEKLQLLLNICESQSISESDFFQKLWGLNYRKEIHSQHLRSSISNFRKLLPLNSLIHQNQLISLK